MNEILKNIRDIRISNGYSQEYVADKIKMASSSYNLIENGKRNLYYETLLQIANVYKMSVIDVITYPQKYVEFNSENNTPVEAILQIKLSGSKKEQVLSLVLGDNHLEILNK